MQYPESSVYLVGHAKIAEDNPINANYNILFVSIVVDIETHIILDISCNAVLDITRNFLCSLLVGCDLLNGLEEASQRLKSRYFGSSQKSIIAALRDANGRLRDILKQSNRL